MDIVIDSRMIKHSGIGVYLKNIIKFIEGPYNIKLLGDPETLKHEFGNIPTIPFYADIYSIKEQIEYNSVIPSCDIFWSPHYNVPAFPVKAKKRIVTIHDVYHLAHFDTLSLPKKIYSKLIMHTAIRMSDRIITVSNFSKSEIIRYTGCPSKKITRIYNGVDNDKKLVDFAYIRSKYYLPDNYLLFVGNIKPHKNLKKFLEAYLLLGEDLQTKYKIVIVGKKDGFITGDEELLKWINSITGLDENIIFTGFVDDEHLDTIYGNAAVLVFPSLYEGFGFPPLEAMKNRCPSAVSDIPSAREVCGNASLYFDPMNEQDISLKITQILNNQILKQGLIDAGALRISEFTWKHAAERHQQVFENLLIR